ncbi:hypothetical protein KUM39_25460 [Streptomyces sp. J2-1]|nr:hypothetical protein [Streptomyces corallincola]MBV2357663.1 hypothetical protein [Streptomyces corallincola]
MSEADLLPKEESRGRELTRFERIRRRSDLTKAEGMTAEEVMSTPAPARSDPARPSNPVGVGWALRFTSQGG